jgi:peroxisomal enoyl-CoA hydratase 2
MFGRDHKNLTTILSRMSSTVDVSKILGYEFPTTKVAYNRRDLILYAIGIGLKDPKYVYELDPSFAPFPAYPLVLGLKGDSFDVNSFAEKFKLQRIPSLPAQAADRVVHGEQYLEIVAPLPVEGSFKIDTKVAGVWDTGKGMIIDQESVLKDDTGKVYAKMITSPFFIGSGGFGGKKKPDQPFMNASDRSPDVIHEDSILPTQHLIYRLSSDYNPLHIDPQVGKRLNMKGAILHGLCTFGHVAAAIVLHFGGNNPNSLKTIYGRFVSPVYPGETLQTEMWKVKEQDDVIVIAYMTKVKERNAIVLRGGSTIINRSRSKL